MEANILLLGLGNILLGDEGLGIRAWERLQKRYRLPEEVTRVDGGVLGLELLAYVDGVTHLLAIDAVQTGQPPGTLVRLEGAEIPKTLSLKLSMHQVSFQEVLAMSYLRGTMPPHLVVWGMEPAVLETGVVLSNIVAVQLDPLVREVVGELRQWGLVVFQLLDDE
jgi:hydrogenase maturation protease